MVAGVLAVSTIAIAPAVAGANSDPLDAVAKESESRTDIRSTIFGLKDKIREAAVVVASPTTGAFTSGFAPRWGTFHDGIDIANVPGTPIYAVKEGTVIDSGPMGGYGNWIRIQHEDGLISLYGHMQALHVSVGDKVSAGEYIADMGNLGFSTGSHLHLGIYQADGTAIDPLQWLRDNGVNDW